MCEMKPGSLLYDPPFHSNTSNQLMETGKNQNLLPHVGQKDVLDRVVSPPQRARTASPVRKLQSMLGWTVGQVLHDAGVLDDDENNEPRSLGVSDVCVVPESPVDDGNGTVEGDTINEADFPALSSTVEGGKAVPLSLVCEKEFPALSIPATEPANHVSSPAEKDTSNVSPVHMNVKEEQGVQELQGKGVSDGSPVLSVKGVRPTGSKKSDTVLLLPAIRPTSPCVEPVAATHPTGRQDKLFHVVPMDQNKADRVDKHEVKQNTAGVFVAMDSPMHDLRITSVTSSPRHRVVLRILSNPNDIHEPVKPAVGPTAPSEIEEDSTGPIGPLQSVNIAPPTVPSSPTKIPLSENEEKKAVNYQRQPKRVEKKEVQEKYHTGTGPASLQTAEITKKEEEVVAFGVNRGNGKKKKAKIKVQKKAKEPSKDDTPCSHLNTDNEQQNDGMSPDGPSPRGPYEGDVVELMISLAENSKKLTDKSFVSQEAVVVLEDDVVEERHAELEQSLIDEITEIMERLDHPTELKDEMRKDVEKFVGWLWPHAPDDEEYAKRISEEWLKKMEDHVRKQVTFTSSDEEEDELDASSFVLHDDHLVQDLGTLTMNLNMAINMQKNVGETLDAIQSSRATASRQPDQANVTSTSFLFDTMSAITAAAAASKISAEVSRATAERLETYLVATEKAHAILRQQTVAHVPPPRRLAPKPDTTETAEDSTSCLTKFFEGMEKQLRKESGVVVVEEESETEEEAKEAWTSFHHDWSLLNSTQQFELLVQEFERYYRHGDSSEETGKGVIVVNKEDGVQRLDMAQALLARVQPSLFIAALPTSDTEIARLQEQWEEAKFEEALWESRLDNLANKTKEWVF
jgi:hypothetical protein